jgi:hypothetical protein
MPASIDLFTKRYLQITFMFMLFSWIYEYAHIPHASWIVITGASIYSGFDPSAVLKRAYMRFSGTVVGIAAVVILWHLIHFDYRSLIFFLVFIAWGMVFFQGLPYRRFMIMTTLFSDLINETSNSDYFYIQYYIFDRFTCVAIVFSLCIVIEQIWFGRSNLTRLNYDYSQQAVYDDLRHFYQMTLDKRISRAQLFKELASIHQQITHLRGLMTDQKFEGEKDDYYQHTEDVVARILHVFRKIVCVVYLRANDRHNPAMASLRAEIDGLLSTS